MNTTTASSSSIADPIAVPPKTNTSRCPYLYPNAKRCRLPGLPAHAGFCLGHSQANAPTAFPVNVQNDSEDLSSDLLPELSEFDSAVDINLSRPAPRSLVTKGRVSPRRASVLGYITNQLLHSHRAIDRENLLQLEDAEPPRVELGDFPRPGHSRRTTHEQPPMAWAVPAANLDPEKAPL